MRYGWKDRALWVLAGVAAAAVVMAAAGALAFALVEERGTTITSAVGDVDATPSDEGLTEEGTAGGIGDAAETTTTTTPDAEAPAEDDESSGTGGEETTTAPEVIVTPEETTTTTEPAPAPEPDSGGASAPE